MQIGSHTELLNFLRELEALANLRHPNVVPFCAAVLEVGWGPDLWKGGGACGWVHVPCIYPLTSCGSACFGRRPLDGMHGSFI